MRWLFAVITMYDQQIKLINETKDIDKYGNLSRTQTERIVFAELKSIGQSEFYQANALGLKPEIKFVLPHYLEYQNEKKIKYQAYGEMQEEIYTVIRTFRTGNELEIVCKRGAE